MQMRSFPLSWNIILGIKFFFCKAWWIEVSFYVYIKWEHLIKRLIQHFSTSLLEFGHFYLVTPLPYELLKFCFECELWPETDCWIKESKPYQSADCRPISSLQSFKVSGSIQNLIISANFCNFKPKLQWKLGTKWGLIWLIVTFRSFK